MGVLGEWANVRLDDFDMRGTFGLTADNTIKTPARKPGSGSGKRSTRGADQHLANALRNAYEEAVQEDVPPEFLDLLGKLT